MNNVDDLHPASIPIKESMRVCNANRPPLFGDVFTTPKSPLTTVYVVRRTPYVAYWGGPLHACSASQCRHYRTCSTYTRTFGGYTHHVLGALVPGATNSSAVYFHNDCPDSTGLGHASSDIRAPSSCASN